MYFWALSRVPPGTEANVVLAAEANPKNPFQWKLITNLPLVGPDSTGRIRDKGVALPFVLPRQDGPWLMYYSSLGSLNPKELGAKRSARTGLAVSQDSGLTWQVEKEIVLPTGEAGSYDAGLTGSVFVLRRGCNDYVMWYTAGEKYVHFGKRIRGIVHLGVARSQDGITWEKFKEPAIRARMEAVDPYEAVTSKPAVLHVDGIYHMWFSVYKMAPGTIPSADFETPNQGGGNAQPKPTTSEAGYRIEYARSTDGIHWERFADQPVLPLTPSGFDSKNQSYPSIIEMGDQLWMFYTGNDFGKTGIGLATMDKSALQ